MWTINQAGVLLNKYRASDDLRSVSRSERLLDSYRFNRGSETDIAFDRSFYRTLAAVSAARHPTESEFLLLLRGWRNGRLDRTGLLWFAEVASATGNWQEARAAYARVDATNLLVHRGDTSLVEDRSDQAASWYGMALASVEGRISRGTRPYSEVPSGPGEDAIALLRIGKGFLAAGRPIDARDALRSAVAQLLDDPPSPRDTQSILFTLAEAELASAEIDQGKRAAAQTRALSLIREANAVESTAWAHVRSAKILLLVDERAKAIVELKLALSLDTAASEAYLALGAIFEEDGLAALARDLYRRGVDALPTDTALLAALAKATYNTAGVDRALPLLTEAAATRIADPYVYAYLGDCLAVESDYAGARQAYLDGLRLAPASPPLVGRLAETPRPTGATP